MKAARLGLPILLTGLCHLQAATLYWDTNGDTTGAGTAGVSTGTWDGTTSNWTSDSTGASVTGSYVADSDVVFAAGSDVGTASTSTITIGTDMGVHDLTFEEGKYSFSGGSLILSDGADLSIGSGASLSLAGTSLKIAGAVVLTNNSSTSMGWSAGGFNVMNGIVTPKVTFSGGSFTIRASGVSDSSGGGAFSMIIENGSSVTHGFNGTNTYSGGTFIKAGSLRALTNINMGSGAITLGDTSGIAEALLNFTNNTVVANQIDVLAGGNSMISSGGAGNTNRYTGNVSLGGNLTLTTTASSGTTPSIIFDTTSTISGTGGIAMTRNASNLNALNVTLRGNNTYSGGTTVNYGTLNINNGGTSSTNSAIGTGALTINAGRIDNSSTSAVTLATNNAVVLNANLTFTGTNNLNLGTGAVSLGTASGTTRTITTDASTLTLGGVISNGTTAQNIIKAGSGALVLSGNNDYTGTTAVNAGRLFVNGTHSGTGAVTVAATATLGGTGSLAGATTANAGSFFAPGADGAAGTLTFAGTLNISGLAGGTGGLLFDLAASNASDKIGAGALTIGTGLLDLNDFSFTTLGGYTDGVYTLFSATSIVGTLGTNLTGTVGGISSVLSISGNDIILTVGTIPEPSTYALLVGSTGLMVVGLRRYRNRRSL